MNALRLSSLVLLSVFGPGCARFSAATSGQSPAAMAAAAKADADKIAQLGKDATAYAENK